MLLAMALGVGFSRCCMDMRCHEMIIGRVMEKALRR